MAEGCLFEAHQGLVTPDAWVSEAGKPECCHLQMADGIHPCLAAHLCSAVAEDPAFEPGSYLLQTSTHTCNFLAAVDLRPTETRRRPSSRLVAIVMSLGCTASPSDQFPRTVGASFFCSFRFSCFIGEGWCWLCAVGLLVLPASALSAETQRC